MQNDRRKNDKYIPFNLTVVQFEGLIWLMGYHAAASLLHSLATGEALPGIAHHCAVHADYAVTEWRSRFAQDRQGKPINDSGYMGGC